MLIAPVAGIFMAGILMAEFFDLSFIMMFLVCFIAVEIVRLVVTKELSLFKSISVIMFCMGIALSQYSSEPDRKELHLYENMYITATGRICEIPDINAENIRYVLDTKSIDVDGVVYEINEKILVTAKEWYEYGDAVTVKGFLLPLPDKMNKNGFDIKIYYKSKDIFFKMFAKESELCEHRINDYSLYAIATGVRNKISKLIKDYSLDNKGALLDAIVTGNKKGFSKEFEYLLIKSGVGRCLYPAYLHVMLIMLIISLFSEIIPAKTRDYITIAVMIAYAVIESTHPVFVKSCLIMIFAIIHARIMGYNYMRDVAGAVVIAVGISNPLLMYNAGFVMSIAATILIDMFSKPVDKRLSGIKNYYIRKSLTSGIICTLGLMPLGTYYFNGINIYMIIFTMPFLILDALIILLSPLLLLMQWIFGTTPVIGQVVTTLLWVYVKLAEFIDFLPFSYVTVASPPKMVVVLSYLAVYGMRRLYVKKPIAKELIIASVTAIAMITAGEIKDKINTMEVTFVNVGQGDGAYIKIPFKNVVLIDGGGGTMYNSTYNPGESIYLPYLATEGIYKIDCAIVSHCHKDHIQGIIAAVKYMDVNSVYVPRGNVENEFLDELLKTAKAKGTKVFVLEEDTKLTFDSGLEIEMILPQEVFGMIDENDTSMLINVKYGNSHATFTGDMTKRLEEYMLKRNKVCDTNLLKVAHHGSDTSSSEEFLKQSKPEVAVINVGEDNHYGLPSDNVLNRLRGVDVLRTDINGDVTVIMDRSGIREIETYR